MLVGFFLGFGFSDNLGFLFPIAPSLFSETCVGFLGIDEPVGGLSGLTGADFNPGTLGPEEITGVL